MKSLFFIIKSITIIIKMFLEEIVNSLEGKSGRW